MSHVIRGSDKAPEMPKQRQEDGGLSKPLRIFFALAALFFGNLGLCIVGSVASMADTYVPRREYLANSFIRLIQYDIVLPLIFSASMVIFSLAAVYRYMPKYARPFAVIALFILATVSVSYPILKN